MGLMQYIYIYIYIYSFTLNMIGIMELNNRKYSGFQNAVMSWYQLLAFAPVLWAIIYQRFNMSLVVGITLFDTGLVVPENRPNCGFNFTIKLSWTGARISQWNHYTEVPTPLSPTSDYGKEYDEGGNEKWVQNFPFCRPGCRSEGNAVRRLWRRK
jgi:hypothetical protein